MVTPCKYILPNRQILHWLCHRSTLGYNISFYGLYSLVSSPEIIFGPKCHWNSVLAWKGALLNRGSLYLQRKVRAHALFALREALFRLPSSETSSARSLLSLTKPKRTRTWHACGFLTGIPSAKLSKAHCCDAKVHIDLRKKPRRYQKCQ